MELRSAALPIGGVVNLAEALSTETTRKGPACTVANLIDDLDADDAATLQAAIDNRVQYAAISRALAKMGHSVKPQTISRHARRECGCEPR